MQRSGGSLPGLLLLLFSSPSRLLLLLSPLPLSPLSFPFSSLLSTFDSFLSPSVCKKEFQIPTKFFSTIGDHKDLPVRTHGIFYRAHPKNVKAMMDVGRVNVAHLANNHQLDFGTENLFETVRNVGGKIWLCVAKNNSTNCQKIAKFFTL